jgi:hypothetical protein
MKFEPDTDDFQYRIDYEWVKEPLAIHQVISILGPGSSGVSAKMQMEIIQIGNTIWTKIGGEWIKAEYSQIPTQKANWEGIERSFRDLHPVGEEKANGIKCIHYTVDEDLLKVTGSSGQNVTTHAKGDLWIANQSDLPPVAIRMRIEMSTSGMFSLMPTSTFVPTPRVLEQQLVYQVEYDIIDINIPIVIEPPAGI